MDYTEIRNTGSFALQIDHLTSDPSGIIPLLSVEQLSAPYEDLSIDYFLGYEFLIEALQVTINLNSLDEAPIPDIAPEDTQAERQRKLFEIQRDYPKVGLGLFKSNGLTGAFKRQAIAILQNPGSEWYLPLLHPYLSVGEVKLLGHFDRLGVQIVDLGSGLLQEGDSLLIEGSWRQVLSLTRKASHKLISNSFGADVYMPTGGIGTLILPANSLRRLLVVANPGTLRVWLGFTPNFAINGSLYLDPGGSVSLESLGMYFGEALYAKVSVGTGRVTGIEGSLIV